MGFLTDPIDLHPDFKDMVDKRAVARGYGSDAMIKAGEEELNRLLKEKLMQRGVRSRLTMSGRRGGKTEAQRAWAREYLGDWAPVSGPPNGVPYPAFHPEHGVRPAGPVYDCQRMTMEQAMEQSAVAKLPDYKPYKWEPTYSEEGGY